MRTMQARSPFTQRESTGREGMAMVIAILVLTSLVTLTYTFLQISLGHSKNLGSRFDDQRAFLLADAGLHEAYEALRGGGSGAIASAADPAYLGGGVFWVASAPLPNDQTQLTATALIGSGRHALTAVVRDDTGAAPLFQTTLNSKETLTLNEGVLIDSFDSSLGTYASQAVNITNALTHANRQGHARSNKGIECNANVTVMGDAIPGPGYSVTQGNGSYVDGSTTPAPEPFTFPAVAVPSYALSPAISVPNSGSLSLPAGQYELPSLSIGRNASLQLTGPATIVVDDFTGGKDAGLLIDASAGPVTIHVRGAYSHISGFEVNSVNGSPTAVAFMLQGTQDVVFPSSTAIRGAYYAPSADIVFSSNNECWGAFAANQIVMSNDMAFHFDEDLLNHFNEEVGANGDPFEVLTWATVPVQPDSLRLDRRDPMQVLGLQRAQLRSPAARWEVAP